MTTLETLKTKLTCSLCLGLFKDPRVLPCLHTFCKCCLQEHISKTQKLADNRHFYCPICDCRNQSAKDDLERSKWADGLPINHLFQSMVQNSGIEAVPSSSCSNTHMDTDCIPCSLDGKRKVSFCYCLTCTEHLCQICYKDHMKFKATRNHMVLKGKKLSKHLCTFEKISKQLYCKVHTERHLEFKCLDHQQFICSLCATLNHRLQCRLVYIDNLPNEDASLKEHIDKASNLVLKTRQNLSSVFTDVENLNRGALAARHSVDSLIDKLRTNLQHIKTIIILESFRQAESDLATFATRFAECFRTVTKLEDLNMSAKTVLKYGSQRQVAVLTEEIRKQIPSVQKFITTQLEVNLVPANARALEQLSIVFGVLLDISSKLIDKMDNRVNKHGNKNVDYSEDEEFWIIYKEPKTGKVSNTLTKIVLPPKPKSYKSSSTCIPKSEISITQYKTVDVATDAVQRKEKSSETVILKTKDAYTQTALLCKKDKLVGPTALLTQDQCIATMTYFMSDMDIALREFMKDLEDYSEKVNPGTEFSIEDFYVFLILAIATLLTMVIPD